MNSHQWRKTRRALRPFLLRLANGLDYGAQMVAMAKPEKAIEQLRESARMLRKEAGQ